MAGGAQEPTLGSEGVTPGSVVPPAEDGELGGLERKARWPQVGRGLGTSCVSCVL